MQMSGSRDIAADKATVWAALLNPEVLQEIVPGASDVTGNSEDGFEACVTQKVGPVKATFRGTFTVSNLVEGRSLTLTGEGKGGPAGFAKGSADVHMEEAGGVTTLSYDVEAKVGGKLAQIGSRIVDGFAKKVADQFFTRLEEVIVGPQDVAPEAPSDDPVEIEARKKGSLKKLID